MPDSFEDEPLQRGLGDADNAVHAVQTYNYVKTIKSQIFYGVATATAALNIVGIILVHTSLMYAASAFAIFIAPIIIYQECQMEDIDSLRTVQNNIRDEVNDMANQNKVLEGQCMKLKEENDELQQTKDSLEELAVDQGSNVSELVALVEENRKLVLKQAKIVRQDLAQTIVQTLIGIDRNNNNKIDEGEIQRVIHKLRAERNRVHVNEELLQKKIKERPSFRNLINMTNDLTKIDTPDDELVFTLARTSIRGGIMEE